MSLADYVGHAMRLAKDEKNVRIQQQISSSIVATIDLMQRLRPETDDALARLLPVLELQAFRHAADATTGDLKRIWFNTFIGVVSTETGVATVRALLNGTTELPGLDISADTRWILLMILSRHGVEDIDALLAAESSSDVSDFGAKSALTANAALPDQATKAKWLTDPHRPREAACGHGGAVSAESNCAAVRASRPGVGRAARTQQDGRPVFHVELRERITDADVSCGERRPDAKGAR
jgi:hypothetical protein